MLKSEFAAKIGKTAAFVSMMCNGQRRPNWETANRCAEFAGGDAAWWMDAPSQDISNVIQAATNKKNKLGG